jgi:hypothetical protein
MVQMPFLDYSSHLPKQYHSALQCITVKSFHLFFYIIRHYELLIESFNKETRHLMQKSNLFISPIKQNVLE